LLSQVFKVYFTLKHLRFKQVFYRIVYKFKTIEIPYVDSISEINDWKWNGPTINEQSLFENNEVRFLSLGEKIDNATSWNSSSKDKLWLYNLHYFDDLCAYNYRQRESIHYQFISRWIDENPPCAGNGWEPYPLSLRLVNWVKWFSDKKSVEKKYLLSIHQQSQALLQQLEYHILGNHLFANGKALVFVGAFLKGEFAESCLSKGLEILDGEIEEQFLSDGGHFELSPMYHCILLWDLLELIHLAEVSKNTRLTSRLAHLQRVAQKALLWLESMLHSDGEISFFNDAAIGIAHSPEEIFKFAKSLNIKWGIPLSPLHTNSDTGYSRVKLGNYCLIMDCAQVGPDYLPGHAHADTLSFELSIADERVFVNSGTSLYGVSEERLRQRQTAAHNTVEVCGQSSSEVWSGFRVARRATATLEEAVECQEYVRLTASHDGYKRLRPKVNHRRSITANAHSLKIEDSLTEKVSAMFHLHIHPDVQCTRINSNSVRLTSKKGKRLVFSADSTVELLPTTFHPNFGVTIPTQKIVIPFESGHLVTCMDIEG
jgi:uncharacterized heparinase superfamily protein